MKPEENRKAPAVAALSPVLDSSVTTWKVARPERFELSTFGFGERRRVTTARTIAATPRLDAEVNDSADRVRAAERSSGTLRAVGPEENRKMRGDA